MADIDKDILSAALARAITDSVGPEIQRKVFAEAMEKFLFRTERDGQSVITESFKKALQISVEKLADDVVSDPANRRKLVDAVQGAFDDAVRDDMFKKTLTEKVLRSFGRW